MVSCEFKHTKREVDPISPIDLLTCRETPSPKPFGKYLSFSLCPYESTVQSLQEYNPEDLLAQPERKRKLTMDSVKSGSSSQSRFSTRSSLQQVMLFDRACCATQTEQFRGRLKATREEIELLRGNAARLSRKRNYLEAMKRNHLQRTVAEASILKSYLKASFFRPRKQTKLRK